MGVQAGDSVVDVVEANMTRCRPSVLSERRIVRFGGGQGYVVLGQLRDVAGDARPGRRCGPGLPVLPVLMGRETCAAGPDPGDCAAPGRRQGRAGLPCGTKIWYDTGT